MKIRINTALPALAATLISLPALAQTPADGSRYWHYGSDWGWGHMVFGSLMMVLFWGALIVAIVFAVRWLGTGSSQGASLASERNKALDILQQRFARGEIDQEEFADRKRHLTD
uniref:SHOCT domain-containing protein n=1 Tax=Pararhizobium sp. IMCC3301 TaxID=3067904 RepID=UPI0027418B93|nr:SHOCT domain-containing protein [Pararhizobium sp. IMCC3301]